MEKSAFLFYLLILMQQVTKINEVDLKSSFFETLLQKKARVYNLCNCKSSFYLIETIEVRWSYIP